MKVFTVEAVFELPEDFEGDEVDALIAFAEYEKLQRHTVNGSTGGAGIRVPHSRATWEAFWNRPPGHRAAMACAITEEGG